MRNHSESQMDNNLFICVMVGLFFILIQKIICHFSLDQYIANQVDETYCHGIEWAPDSLSCDLNRGTYLYWLDAAGPACKCPDNMTRVKNTCGDVWQNTSNIFRLAVHRKVLRVPCAIDGLKICELKALYGKV